MPALCDYEFEPVHETSQFTLRRGHETRGSGSILVRSPIGDPVLPMHLKWLEHEYVIAPQLDSHWAISPLELTQHDGRPMLVMEDPGGHPLDVILQNRLDVEDFLRVAILTAEALSGMHQKGLVHKDIKPANIFLDSAGQVRLTGFGLASTLPRERQAPVPLEVISGTFAYMAPEQTGRMNRSIDARSDLYALGVTFYEMITGQLPFVAADPLEWVHCHTALKPPPPSERADVPRPICAIIMKLLAKTADDRYQTADGLAADLRRCKSQWDQCGTIDLFALGDSDKSDRLLISERLYGRDTEIELLIAAFDRVVAAGTAELVLVSGYSGVGKSSVVNELHKVLVPPRGLFASGKFDQYKRDIPYATLAQAFQSLVRQILGKSATELEHWRNGFQEALGSNGQIMVNLIPDLEAIIGPQPPIPELSAQDAASRFQNVFRLFLEVFAKPEHPLALFLDDLQWLDIATLQLLQYLITHPEVRNILLIGAYRDNEVHDAHPLLRTIEDIRKSGKAVKDIVLSPLSQNDIGQLIEDALHSQPGKAFPLTALVYKKTGGNPFFVIQFVTELAEKKLLFFDSKTRNWQWDIKKIQDKGFTDNVIDLMAAKLNRLPQETQLALQRFACLGNIANIKTLLIVEEQPEPAVHRALLDAVRIGLVLRHAETYSFLHDRVQEAAYAMIPTAQRATVHLKIGRRLASSMSEEEVKEMIFEIVNQFDRGASLIQSEAEKDNIATLFLAAAQQARASTAYASALKYLMTGLVLLGPGGWERQYDLTFAFQINAAECEFLTGDHHAAETRIVELIKLGRTKVDLAAAYRLRITMHVVMSENRQAIDAALECLRLFDIDMDPHPSLQEVGAAFFEIQTRLAERPIETLIELPLATDPDVEAAMSVLSVLWAPAIYTDEPLVGLHTCHMVRLTLDHGVTAASPQGLGWYGIMLGHLSFGDYQEGYKFGRLAADLVEKYQFNSYQAKALYSLHMLGLWNQPISTVLETIQSVFLACVKTGDVTIACYACNHMINDRLERGDHLDEIFRESERSLAFVEKVGYRIVIDCIISLQRWILQLQGRTDAFATLNGGEFNEEIFEASLTSDSMATVVFWYWILKGQARYMAGRFDEAVAAFDRARTWSWGSPGHIQNADFQFFSALAMAALDPGGEADPLGLERRSYILKSNSELGRWTKTSPSTFAVQNALISAEIARIEGHAAEAIRLYERAISLAKEYALIHYEAIAHEVAARFHIQNRFDTCAHAHLRLSRECYQRWGAYGKVEQLEGCYPILRERKSTPSLIQTTDAPVGRLDILAFVKAMQAVSREIVLDELIKTLLTITVEAAGAERGTLVLVRNDVPRVVAVAEIIAGELEINLAQKDVSAAELPESTLQYVIRTKEILILDDAAGKSDFSSDKYIMAKKSKSILLLPIVKQGRLSGVLCLENSLLSHAFTSERITILELLAAQAAISLENASLYTELRRSEAFLAEGQRHSATATWSWNVDTGEIQWSDEHFYLFGYTPGQVTPNFDFFLEGVHPEDRMFVEHTLHSAVSERKPFTFEFRGRLPSGEIKYFLAVGQEMDREHSNLNEYMGTLVDISERKRGEKALMTAQEDFRRVARMTAMAELAAAVAHEVNQPLSAIVTNANACLRWLADERTDIAAARRTAQSIVDEGHRAGAIIKGIYRLAKKQSPESMYFDINLIIREVLALMRSELELEEVVVQTELGYGALCVYGDGVQLRQVILNLVRNGMEAMTAVENARRVIKLTSYADAGGEVHVVVEDNGPGLSPTIVDQIFEAFVTTKFKGLGMGLSICRSIIEAHGGRLWLEKSAPSGAVFKFSLPSANFERLSEDAA